jgi:hypothetical protein
VKGHGQGALLLLQLSGTVGKLSKPLLVQAAATAAADADAESAASAAHGVSSGRSQLFFHAHHSHNPGQGSNNCVYASDGDCDDGGPGAQYTACSLGTDCVDCGPRSSSHSHIPHGLSHTHHPHTPHSHHPHTPHSHHPHTPHIYYPPPPLPSPPYLPPPSSDGSTDYDLISGRRLQTAQACTETCNFASDGWCDDGGPGAEYSVCSRGTDCTDCGTAAVVSNSAGLTSALANTAVGRIVLASGTYYLIAELSITRSVIIEAAVAGSVILNAQASSSSPRRVLNINPGPSGVVQLIGLRITGGYRDHGGGVAVVQGTVSIVNSQVYSNQATSVRAHSQKFPSKIADMLALSHACTLAIRSTSGGAWRGDLEKFPSPRWETHVCSARCFQGGGVRVDGGTVTISSCTISGNTALVRIHAQKLPLPRWEDC